MLLADLDVRAVVNAAVEPGDRRLVLHGVERRGAGREQVRQDRGRRGREGRVPRGVRREVRQADHRLDARVQLRRARVEVGELDVPAADGGVVHRHVEQGEGARRADLAQVGVAHVLRRDVVPVARRRVRARAIGPLVDDGELRPASGSRRSA